MREEFALECDWLPQDFGNEVEQRTAAEVGVRVGDVYLTELEDLRAKTVRQRMRVSANNLALWLAGNWWRLRWEAEPRNPGLDWRMSHCMAAAGGGHVWPDLLICSDGETVRLESKVSARYNFPVHYLYSAKKTIVASDFEQGVDNFIEFVVARLIENNLRDNDLISLWREVKQERDDPALASYRKMEALMGFDAGECSDLLMGKLEILVGEYGRGAIEEIASAYGSDVLTTIDRLISDGKSVAQPIIIPESAKIRKGMHREQLPRKQIGQPWQLADLVAKKTRSEWDISPNEPISTRAFASLVQMAPALLENSDVAGNSPISAGFRNGAKSDAISIVLDKKPITSRRFALARIIGDYFYAKPEDQVLPATHAATVRQKFQRAFAQELLCPYEGLISIVGEHVSDDDAIEDAASVFEVSPLLVRTTLVNKGVLDRECLL